VKTITDFRPLPVDDIGTHRAWVLPGSRFLLVLSRQSNVWCFDAYSGERHAICNSDSERKLGQFLLSPNRRVALVRATRRLSHGTVRAVWDLENRSVIGQVKLQGTGASVFFAITDDASLVLTDAVRRSVDLYDLSTGQQVRSYPINKDPTANRVSMSPDGRRILLAGDSRAELIDREQPAQSGSFIGGRRCQAATLSRDNRLVAMAGTRLLSTQVTIFSVAGKNMLHAITAHRKAIHGLAFSDDGRFLFCGSEDGTVTAWDTATGHQLCHFLKNEAQPLHGIDLSPDGRLVVAYSREGDAAVWQTPETMWSDTAAVGEEGGIAWHEAIPTLLSQTLP
jgi:WD40 repeat protein